MVIALKVIPMISNRRILMELQYIPKQSHLLTVFQQVIATKNIEERKELADELWNRIVEEKANPLIVEESAYFFVCGNKNTKEILVAGDWTHWRPGGKFQKIEHTDLFYSIQNFAKTSRLQYKIIIDGEWLLDPANHRIAEEGFGVNSEFWMSEYVDDSYMNFPFGNVPSGKVQSHILQSKEVEYDVTLYVYTPPTEYQSPKSIPLLVVLDGEESLSIGKFNQIVDNLTFAKKIPPIMMVFVKPTNRHLEYIDNDNYCNFLKNEVVNFAQNIAKKNSLSLSSQLSDRAIIGASLGGLISTNLVLKNPNVFGVCIAQSPAYWWNKGEIYKSPYLQNASNLSFILHTGTVCDAKELTYFMKQRLIQHRVGHVVYREFAQGHTWGNWKTNFATALIDWFSKENTLH